MLLPIRLFVRFQFTHPARGATRLRHGRNGGTGRFNSRTPHGVRPCLWCVARVVHWFQFTHPARGATLVRKKAPRNVGVSIHAPRTGCDKGNDHTECTPTSFNSRTPHGVRQALRNNYDTIYIVSIHAPRTGCDSPSKPHYSFTRRFNSRTPHGVRPRPTKLTPLDTCFNSRTPHGVRQGYQRFA